MRHAPKVTVPQLLAHPEQYRGKPVVVRGDLWSHDRLVVDGVGLAASRTLDWSDAR